MCQCPLRLGWAHQNSAIDTPPITASTPAMILIVIFCCSSVHHFSYLLPSWHELHAWESYPRRKSCRHPCCQALAARSRLPWSVLMATVSRWKTLVVSAPAKIQWPLQGVLLS